ncbi:MAG: hypothetical protein ACTHNG_13900 [Ginsengibacter sp.]|jgi:hypothetical protein
MEDNLKATLITVCKLLEKYNVKYLIVGGTAVALNGYYRHSTNASGQLTNKPDIDIWYNSTFDNYFRILKVIEALGQDISEFENEKMPNPRISYFKLDLEDFTIDFLPAIKSNIKFLEVYNRKGTIQVDETKIYFLDILDLIKDKEATARKKDLEDIKQLKKIKNSK